MLQQCEREILEEIIAKQDEQLCQMSLNLNAAGEKIRELQQEVLDLTGGEFNKRIDRFRKAEAKLNERLYNVEKRLSPTQIQALQRNSTRGLMWGIGEIRDGLILKMKCGTSGYDAWVKYLPILPAVRTLQKNVQHVIFRPGMMLHAVFDMLEVLGNVMPDSERDCQLVMDEMQLEPTPKFDMSLGEKVGEATLPGHEGKANKALLFLLAGITTRWKLSVRVEFTNKKEEKKSDSTGLAYKKIVGEIIEKSESVGLRVSNVTTDMGADNLACWRAYGVTANKRRVCSSFQNPVRPNAQVFLLPDVVHLMKNTKAMLESNGTIELPLDVVEEAGLTSSIVDYKHIEDLQEYERDNELKVAFRLKEDNIHTKKHFSKMNVGTAKAVLCHRTGVGLKVLAEEKEDPSYNTTAWFILLLNTFFTLATARHRGLAISKHNMGAYEKSTGLIRQISHIFEMMKVGEGQWKPVQRGMMMLCNGYLSLIDYFLNEKKLPFLMLGRFSSDCIENLFSLIRLRQATPNASLFLQNLKVITLAQYSSYVKGSNYDSDSGSPMSNVDFLQEARKRAYERATERFSESLDELMNNPVDEVGEEDFKIFDALERSVIYDMAGSTLARVKTSNAIICDICLSAVLWKGISPHPDAMVTVLKEFVHLKEDETTFAQICVSDEVYKAVLSAEVTFRRYRVRALKLKAVHLRYYFVENLMYVWKNAHIPDCHQIGKKILDNYLDGRIKHYFKVQGEVVKANERIVRSSRMVAGRQAARQMV